MSQDNSQQNMRSIHDMLYGERKEPQYANNEVAKLREELKKKEQQLEKMKEQTVQKQERVEALEGTPSASKEQLEKIVSEVQETKELKERVRVDEESVEQKKQSAASVKQKAAIKTGVADDIAQIMQLDRPKQAKALVFIALKKGIHHAFDVAKSMKNPYIMDEFHDALVSQLHDILKKSKKLKKR